MTKLRNFTIAIIIILIVLAFISAANAAKPDDPGPANKVTICHATSSATNPYTRIVVSENAIGGHFDNPGTPKAGHEQDILLQGEQDCPEPETPPTDDPEVPTDPSLVIPDKTEDVTFQGEAGQNQPGNK